MFLMEFESDKSYKIDKKTLIRILEDLNSIELIWLKKFNV